MQTHWKREVLSDEDIHGSPDGVRLRRSLWSGAPAGASGFWGTAAHIPASKSEAEAYEGFTVYYTRDGRFEAAEFQKGTNLQVEETPVPWDYFGLKTWLLAIDPDAEVSEDGIISAQHGVGVFAVGDDVQSILFAASDYYR